MSEPTMREHNDHVTAKSFTPEAVEEYANLPGPVVKLTRQGKGEAMSESQQCRHETEVARWGRHVVDYKRCGNRTRHPSGLCWRHRSTFHDEQYDALD